MLQTASLYLNEVVDIGTLWKYRLHLHLNKNLINTIELLPTQYSVNNW